MILINDTNRAAIAKMTAMFPKPDELVASYNPGIADFARRFRWDQDVWVLSVDVETGGFDPKRCALTEIGFYSHRMRIDSESGTLKSRYDGSICILIHPPDNLEISEKAAEVQGSTPDQLRLRPAVSEAEALFEAVAWIAGKIAAGQRFAGIVAHNAPFDHSFLSALHQREAAAYDGLAGSIGRLLLGGHTPRQRRSIDHLHDLCRMLFYPVPTSKTPGVPGSASVHPGIACTRSLWRETAALGILPPVADQKLATLAQAIGKQQREPHRAVYDAELCGDVLAFCLASVIDATRELEVAGQG